MLLSFLTFEGRGSRQGSDWGTPCLEADAQTALLSAGQCKKWKMQERKHYLRYIRLEHRVCEWSFWSSLQSRYVPARRSIRHRWRREIHRRYDQSSDWASIIPKPRFYDYRAWAVSSKDPIVNKAVGFFYLWGQAPKLSAGVRPRDKVSFGNLLLGPGPKVKFW